MQVTGTVTRASHRRTPAGNTFASVLIGRPGTSGIRLRYLADFQPRVHRGQVITIKGVPMMHAKTNVGGASVTIHEPLVADNVTETEKNHPDGYRYCGDCLIALPED